MLSVQSAKTILTCCLRNVLAVGFVVLLLAVPIKSQEPPATAPSSALISSNPGSSILKPEEISGFWSGIVTRLAKEEAVPTAFTAVITTMILALANAVTLRQKRYQARLLRRFTDPWTDASPAEFHNVLLTVGMGGSGKSSLRNHVMVNGEKEIIRTEEFAVYETEVRRNEGLNLRVTCDYKGQDIGTFVRNFLLAQNTVNAKKLKFGYITNLAIVVDVVHPNAHLIPPGLERAGNKRRIVEQSEWQRLGPEERRHAFVKPNSFDRARVKEQLEYWNKPMLDTIFAFTPTPIDKSPYSSGLRSVSLFINKINLLKGNPVQDFHIDSADNPYRSLIHELQERSVIRNKDQSVQFLYNFEVMAVDLDTGCGSFIHTLTNNAVKAPERGSWWSSRPDPAPKAPANLDAEPIPEHAVR